MNRPLTEEPVSRRTSALAIVLVIAVLVLLATQLGVLRFEAAPAEAASIAELAPEPSLNAPPTLEEMALPVIATQFPDTIAGRHAEWAIGQINIDLMNVNEDTLREHFVDSTFDEQTPQSIINSLAALSAADAPYALVGFTAEPEEYRLQAVVRTRSRYFQALTVEVDEETKRLEVLWFAK